jgi:ABC-type branched-subunit amino acid transport system substrate-binding protein
MKFLFPIFLIFALLSSSNGQSASKREWTIFQKGVKEYKEGSYRAAEEHFKLLLEKLPGSQLLTAYKLMLAKSRYKLGKHEESITACQEFLKTHPNSDYRDDINYLLANNQYRLKNYYDAVRLWVETAEMTTDRRLSRMALQHAENAMAFRLNKDALLRLSESSSEGILIKDMARYYLADRYYQEGDLSSTNDVIQTIIESGSNSIYAQKARDLESYIEFKRENVIRIAALLPLSGANGDVGNGLYEGVQLAAENFSSAHNLNIEVVPYDYETRMTTALHKMREIAANRSIMAVFGPVENDISAACAVVADYEDITIVSPTASSDELLDLSENLVLLAPTVKSMAENLNRFAADSLKLKRIVTFAPLDDYFKSFVDAFQKQHEGKDGKIAAQQWYYPGDVDFSKHFKILKRIGLKLEFQDSLMQVDTSLADTAIDSLYRIYQETEKEKLEETKTKIDSADIPVTSFDGLLVPIYRDDLGLIAPQIAYANFETQILGNSDWYAMEDLKKNKNYINGIVFVTDGYLNEEDWDYRQFRNSFRNRFKKSPEKFELIGYDSFNYLLSLFNEGTESINRENFADKISVLQPYRGIYRSFNLNRRHSNQAARILKYYYGQLIPLN